MIKACENCGTSFNAEKKRNRFCSRTCFLSFPERQEVNRFWAKVQKSAGCWIWTAKTNGWGYGQFSAVGNRQELAHRTAWRLTYGDSVPPGKILCHHCDNRACVRPDHLFVGEHLDNYHDCNSKGRRPQLLGSRNGNTKLTAQQVDEIRGSYVRGKTRLIDIARRFGISTPHVSGIVSGRAWVTKAMPTDAMIVSGVLGFGS